MKIVQVIPSFAFGGAEIMCENLIYKQLALGHNVIAVSLFDYHSPITERMEGKGIDIRYMGKHPGPDLSMTGKLKRLFVSEKPDVVHTHLNALKYVAPAANKAGIRCIYTVHNLAQKDASGISQKMYGHFFKKGMAKPVALSETVQKSIADVYGMPLTSIPVVYNGIDLSKCIVKTDYGVGDTIELIHIGRFFEQKNHRGLIDAFSIIHKRYENTVLRLLGDGALYDEIKAYTAELGLSDCVIFEGAKADVYPYLNKADVFLLPSLYEGIPITLIEAMGTGLPIVATEVGGVPDMLENKENALLTACDKEDVAMAVCAFIDSQELREKCGRAALENAERFSAKVMAERYLEVYS